MYQRGIQKIVTACSKRSLSPATGTVAVRTQPSHSMSSAYSSSAANVEPPQVKTMSNSGSALRPAPLLFTPGPLTTSDRVKQAMLRDVGSRDEEGFLNKMHAVRRMLVEAAGATQDTHDCCIVQGAGTHAIESMLGSVLSGTKKDIETGAEKPKKVLILSNGAYGLRQKKICEILGIDHDIVLYSDDQAVDTAGLDKAMQCPGALDEFTHLSLVHHETTAGIINPLAEICQHVSAKYPHLDVLVDSMSAFGAYEVNMSAAHSSCKFLVSSANKCMEGVPGFSYVVYEKQAMEELKDCPPKSLVLDLYSQARGLTEGNGQFRFTPPTGPILAYHEALLEWQEEGGWRGRGGRYKANYDVVKEAVEKMGLKFYVDETRRGYIITTILSPSKHPNWDFDFLYKFLADRGFVIYPGKLSKSDSFRLGTIGKIFPQDCRNLCLVLEEGFREMGITFPLDDTHF